MVFEPETINELMTELRQRATGDRAAMRRVARLHDDLKRQPSLEEDADYRAKIAEAVQGFERGGRAIRMTPELRAALMPEQTPSAPEQRQQQPAPEQKGQQQAAPQQQRQSVAGIAAGAAVSGMSKLYAALRPPAPTTRPPWEEAPQPLGERLAAFERRRKENAAANQVQAAQQAGERAQDALQALSALPGAAPLARVRDAAQGEPGGAQAVVAEMKPGGRFADLRAAFNAALAQDRPFGFAYDKAVREVTAYGQARLTTPSDGFEGMDTAIAQASAALPGRKDGKSVHDDIAEKARQVAEFLKTAVQRIGAAISGTPKPTTAPTLSMTP